VVTVGGAWESVLCAAQHARFCVEARFKSDGTAVRAAPPHTGAAVLGAWMGFDCCWGSSITLAETDYLVDALTTRTARTMSYTYKLTDL